MTEFIPEKMLDLKEALLENGLFSGTPWTRTQL